MILIPSTLQDVVKYDAVFLKRSILSNLIYFKSFSFFNVLLLVKFVGFNTLTKFDMFR